MNAMNVTTNRSDSAREARLRRIARRQGDLLRKSRVRNPHINNQGGWCIVDGDLGAVVAGGDFELDLDDVEWYLNAWRGAPTD